MKKTAIDHYDYPLPKEQIALYPEPERDHSKLLVWRNGAITDAFFYQLPDFLDNSIMLVFNDSKVIHARLLLQNRTGAAIEIFCLEPLTPTKELSSAFTQTGQVSWNCLVGNAKKWKEPLSITVIVNQKPLEIRITKGENQEGNFEVTFQWDDHSVTFAEWLEVYGKMPLPPYIKRDCEAQDEQRYQTVYARNNGSVAAPTAGLHFTDTVLSQLQAKGVLTQWATLHVGAGTFKPVSTQYVEEHTMHAEQLIISKSLIDNILNNKNRKIIAVGTTVTRTLESLYIMGAKLLCRHPYPFTVTQWEIYNNKDLQQFSKDEALKALGQYMTEHDTPFINGNTSLIIMPGYSHKITQGLITNFHQPKSTLLLLIASFLDKEWHTIYHHALTHNYRFLSYGDANLYLPE
jgi:S-adenosylmethionine:tRNA ribosyltransferase-isomerase